MNRRSQQVAVAAVAVFVLGGFLPLWPDWLRIAFLALGLGLLVAAGVIARSGRSDNGGDMAPPHHHAGKNDAAYNPARNTDPQLSPRPDHRNLGHGGGF
jgi:hypothetical protein